MDAGGHQGITVTIETPADGTAVLTVVGEIDMATQPQLERALATVFDAGNRRVVLDLTESPFVDSTLLAVLSDWRAKVVADGGSVAIVATQPWIVKMFAVTKLTERMGLSATRDEALARVAA
jgi:anti-sigma B factor antagonist